MKTHCKKWGRLPLIISKKWGSQTNIVNESNLIGSRLFRNNELFFKNELKYSDVDVYWSLLTNSEVSHRVLYTK